MLFLVWSGSSFLFEVPSGAWADLVDRRRLLLLSGVLYAAGFSVWMLWPTFAGFLLGFVIWSASGALFSGTFEALLYDELAATGEQQRYGTIRSRAETAANLSMAAAMGAAALLFSWGGYALVGWVSVALAGVHVGATLLLPRARPVTTPEPVEPPGVGAYLATLRAGVAEARHNRQVGRILIAYGTVVMLVGFDEFFALVFAEGGATPELVSWLAAVILGFQAIGTWLADRVSRLSQVPFTALVVAGGLLLAAGAALPGVAGYVAVGLGYALATTAYLSGEIALQHAITGRSRATTTSVGGLVSEVGFMASLVLMGVATGTWSVAQAMAVLAVVFTAAAAIPAWRARPSARRASSPQL